MRRKNTTKTTHTHTQSKSVLNDWTTTGLYRRVLKWIYMVDRTVYNVHIYECTYE